MDEQNKDELQNILSEIDEQSSGQPQEQAGTSEEQRIRYMTEEQRREWSGVSEWHDPLAKEKPAPDANDGKLALGSLLCGIAGILTSCAHTPCLIFGIASVTCGIISAKKGETSDRLRKIGIILGSVCLGLTLLRDILWVLGRLFPPE